MFSFLERNKVMLVYLPLIFYWIILFILTSLPTSSVPSVGVNDKVEHFLAFFVLSFLVYLTALFQKKKIFLKKYAILFTFIIVSIYGIFDELHQLFIPGRSCELNDLLADIAGAIIGILILNILLRFYRNREQPAS